MNKKIDIINENELKIVPHHKQLELCTNRPAYRQGREFRAVKVFTIASESQHLFVYGVPKINLRSELKSLFSKYGNISNIHVVSDHDVEIFTECYHIQFERIQSARIAKRLVDNRSFYGGILHVCYAPEYETLEETIRKLHQREKDVLVRLTKYNVNQPKNEVTPQIHAESADATVSNNVNKIRNRKFDKNYQIYSSDDPILSHKQKLNMGTSSTCKYMSQSPDLNGGINNRNHKVVNFKSLIPFPLRKKMKTETIKEKVYGPHLPQSILDNSKNVVINELNNYENASNSVLE